MDNNKKNQLTDENQKWLDDLLSTPDSQQVGAGELAKQFTKTGEDQKTDPVSKPEEVIDEEQVIREAEALVADEEPVADINDEDLEKILSEDWLNGDTPMEHPPIEEDVVPSKEELPFDEYPEENAKKVKQPKTIKEDNRKQRPKKKDRYGLFGIPHIFSTVIWVALILAIGISLGRVFWVCCADMMAFGKKAQTVSITITNDDTAESISQMLSDAGLIKYPKLFKLFITLTGKDDDIGIGTFTLSSQFDYNAMVNAMYSNVSRREVVDIMFPEGYNCAQIFRLLETNGVCTVSQLEEYAANGELSYYWFLEDVERGDKYCLEGYMAPDTYSFYKGDSPRRVIEKFLDEFGSRFTDKMKDDFYSIQEEYENRMRANGFSDQDIHDNKLTLHRLITLASIVQKETASTDESFKIASVYYNRLVEKDPEIRCLNSFATIYYAIGDYFSETKKLSEDQLNFVSDYNTRIKDGIPPGPICNMGVQALYAVLEPDDTNYKYFVYDEANSRHLFTSSKREYEQYLKDLTE